MRARTWAPRDLNLHGDEPDVQSVRSLSHSNGARCRSLKVVAIHNTLARSVHRRTRDLAQVSVVAELELILNGHAVAGGTVDANQIKPDPTCST